MSTATLARSWKQVIGDHVSITKPRIVMLIVLTTWGAMWLAAPQGSDASVVFFTLLGTALAVAASHTFNAYLERDIDALMERTRHRPLVTGRMTPEHAIRYAVILGLLSFALLAWRVNLLSAVLAQLGLAFYVLVYTVWLKRRTPLNTVIGGISGAIPPLIGWAAATGRLDLPAFFLFTLMVFWQPPHFFGLTLYRLDDYRRAGIPMLPVVHGVTATARQVVAYTAAMVLTSLALYYPARLTGPLYLAIAIALGAAYLRLAWRSIRGVEEDTTAWGKRLFFFSMFYLAALFLAMVVDVVA